MQAHRLVLGTLPSADDIARLSDRTPAEAVVTLLAGSAFRASLDAVLAGDSGGDVAPVSLLHWARTRLNVEAPVGAGRALLLAHAIRSQQVAKLLGDPPEPLGFTPEGLAEVLAAPPEPLSAKATLSLHERLERDFLGVGVARIQDIEAAGERAVRFTSDDPALILYLRAEVIGSAPAVEVTFSVAGARKRARASLYVAYGENGFAEDRKIALTPKGRRRYSVILLDPSSIANLRWDPDDAEGEAIIAGVSARPVQSPELTELLSDSLPRFLLALTSPVHARSSQTYGLSLDLTQRLYGHGEHTRGEYSDWILEHEPLPIDAQTVWGRQLDQLVERPLISVVVPTYDTPSLLLREMIESVLAQVYPCWELCIADDASPSPHVREIIDSYCAQDKRIKAVFRERNGHISEASNSALGLATGEWIALLDHDDLLTPDALLSVAEQIAAHPDAQFIYSDEDKLDPDGARYDPFFKPDFSPELLRSQNYLNHLSVHRAANIRAAGGWRKGFEGSQDYDLNLRTLENVNPRHVRHIPKVLYHWRAVDGSTAKGGQEKNYAFAAGQAALQEHVERLGWAAEVLETPGLPFYRVRYDVPEPAPMVSLIIPTRDRADLLETCVQSVLERTEYPAYEILIVDNGSVEPRTFELFNALTGDPRVRVVGHAGPFNYSRINNEAVAQSRGEIVGLVNNDIEVITQDWMREMASWAIQPRVGCVGAKLYFPNDTIQHAGVVLGIGGVAGHPHKHIRRDEWGYFSRAAISHDVSAVTAACLFVRRSVYDEVNGLDEDLRVAFNDVDFCIRVREAGYTNVFTPFAELYHHESVSRGLDLSGEARARFQEEVQFMERRWGDLLRQDPFYSVNLTQEYEDYSLR